MSRQASDHHEMLSEPSCVEDSHWDQLHVMPPSSEMTN